MIVHNHSLLVWLILLLAVFNGIKCIPVDQFLLFGEPADAMLPASDDTSAILELLSLVKFYNETYGAAHVRYKLNCSAFNAGLHAVLHDYSTALTDRLVSFI